jgi:uncharacterized membrane protein YdcZ (DUF606 family)
MKIIGIVLVVAGILALVYQGFTYTKTEKVLDMGSVHITSDNDKTVTLPPYVGVCLVVVGVGLVYFDRRKG